jgi:CRP-like cAMP-binding protein
MSQIQSLPFSQDHIFQNRILARVPDVEREQILPNLEPVELPRDFQVASLGKEIEYIYFLEEGIGSVVAVSPEGQKAEAGMFGKEAFSPTPPAIGSVASLHEIVIQSAGFGHRIDVADFWRLIKICPVFYDLLGKSLYNLATQVSYTALSNAVHSVDERLARWLLMCHDRVPGNQLHLTHDYIALMLAVRRPSVTTSLHVLEGNGFIRAERKCITIRDRAAMEEFARDAYGRPEQELRELFGVA